MSIPHPRTRPALSRREFLRLAGQGLVLVSGPAALTGCGGGSKGGSTGPTPTPGTTPTPGPGPTPSPSPPPSGGPLTPESRMAAIQAVQSQMAAFRGAGPVSDQQIVDFLRSRPEFEEAGSVKSGGAWARFTDGELYVVSQNFFQPDPDKGRATRYQPEAGGRAAGGELPRQDRAHVYNALGTAFLPPHDDIRLWMVKHGYLLAPEREATVEALKSVSGDGVFYMNTHGNYCKTRDNTYLWAMWTADPVSVENDFKYKDLLADGSLVRFTAVHDKAPIQNPFNDHLEGNEATHYAITARFVEKFNWQFGANSLVFINACWSADADFANACLGRGASQYAGWTNAANPDHAWRAARFFFDRMLGQLKGGNNEYPEPDGPQRAFDVAAVVKDLRRRDWHRTQTSHGEGELIFGPTTGEFGLLAPSIKYVETDEINKKLILHGLFGQDLGPGIRYVRVDGTDLNVTKWENERIEADLLPDQFGDVWVQVVARKSNIRQLTRWDGVMDYEAVGPQTLKQKAKIEFRIRADVGKFRNEPSGPLQDRQVAVMAVTEPTVTKAHFAYSGEADLFGPDGQNSSYVQWTGEGDVATTGAFGQFPFLLIRGTIDTASRGLRMEIIPASQDVFKYRSYGKFQGRILGGMTDTLHPGLVSIAAEMFDATDSPYGVPQRYLVLNLDGQWSLPAGERKAEAKPPTDIRIGFLNGEITKIPTRLSWSTVTATKPPREDESRSRK